MSEVIAWWRGEPLDEDALLASVGPGLTPRRDAAPVSAWAWNTFAFELGRRLLVELAGQPGSAAHVIEAAASGIAAVGAAKDLMSDPEAGLRDLAVIEATLRPMATLDGSSAAALLLRVFFWGTRRIRKDRRNADSLAALAAAARDVHAELAALSGDDPEAARQAERASELADARSVVES
jgi:hypothetical protein